jgi:membrane protease YdiL (CAAX protease family)
LSPEIEDADARGSASRGNGQSGLAEPSMLHTIFVGADGLRAGWSLLIFVSLFAGLLMSLLTAIHKFDPHGRSLAPDKSASFHFMFLNDAVPLVVTLFVAWVMSKIERRSIMTYGLGGGLRVWYFFGGLAWGVTCLSILFLMLWKSGLLVIESRLLVGGEIFSYGLLWLLLFLTVAVVEEYLVRGYLQYTLTRGLAGMYRWLFKTRHSAALGFWTAAVIFSLVFGFGHGENPGESPIGLLSAGLAAMVFCLSLWRTGSLWWAIGFHATWDWAQSFVYGVGDSGAVVQHRLLATHPVGRPLLSGGTTGPEGSIFVLVVLVLISCIILFTLPRGNPSYVESLPLHPELRDE